MNASAGELWSAAAVVITALVGGLVAWRAYPRRRTETSDAMSSAVESLADAGEHMSKVWTMTLQQQSATIDKMADEISQIKSDLSAALKQHAVFQRELSEHRGMLMVLTGYVGRLRQQVRDLGHEPHGPPDELLHMFPD